GYFGSGSARRTYAPPLAWFSNASGLSRYVFFQQVLVARRADAVAKLRSGMGAEVLLELLPVVAVVADALAVRANGEKPLELLDLAQGLFQLGHALRQALLQAHHARPHLDAGAQLRAVERFGHVVVGPGFQTGHKIFLLALGRQQDEVGRSAVRQLTDQTAQSHAVHSR